jgi:peptide/nickel transport system ATP-binding protein
MNETDNVLLDVKGLKKYFPLTGSGVFRKTVGYIKAVDDVTFKVHRGETVGVVGESGCGKTTLGRCVSRLYDLTDGQIALRYDGKLINVETLTREENHEFRRNVQVIFQDPYSSLNPRMTVLQMVGESLLVNGIARGKELEERVTDVILRVGLRVEHLRRYPHSFSGGQRQRIGLARALVVKPRLIVADEPVSALDVSIQAQILNQLKDLQQDFGLSYIFISHNMSVIRYMSDRVLVMYAGRLVETAPRETLLNRPQHPYTEMLLSAVPRGTQRHNVTRAVTRGEPPNLLKLPTGCVFHPRCKYAKEICEEQAPSLLNVGEQHQARCHFAAELSLTGITG